MSERSTPSREEAAAITAALVVIEAERRAIADEAGSGDRLDEWQRASRLSARGMGMPRGQWRLSGRINRRFRA